MKLRDYQVAFTDNIIRSLIQHKHIIAQLATGGGKTISFSSITQRYTQKNEDSVLILVHRVELLKQTRATLYNHFGIIANVIDAKTRKEPHKAKVYLAMVETWKRRSFKLPIGLIIIDEAHLGNFSQILRDNESKMIIGFTATPVSSKKKDPLKNYFKDIVCGVDIPELIEMGALCHNKTYVINNVDTSKFGKRMGEFNEGQMCESYSKPKQLLNTIEGYRKFCEGQKTLCFNVNVEHSLKVNQAFLDAGFNSKHIDGNYSDASRTEIFKWFTETDDAILHNVGIATTGTDIPSVKNIIVNYSTLSLSKWLQTTGRGSRPFENKTTFNIIDLGGNALLHGDWCDMRDWVRLFHEPDKPNEGVAPVKDCPKCNYLMHARVMECPNCHYIFPATKKEDVYDNEIAEFRLITSNIDVETLTQYNKANERKDYYTFFQLGTNIATRAKYQFGKKINDTIKNELVTLYFDKAREWCALNNKKFNKWHQDTAKNHLLKTLDNAKH
jgi:superfamily II DNA or RNA helicase